MEDFDLREYLANNVLLKEDRDVEMWDNMDEEERLYTLLNVVEDPDKAEDLVDKSFYEHHEPEYDGYGNFGGEDYYDVLATMNGFTQEDIGIKNKKGHETTELRSIGINLAFGEIDPKEGEVLFPALVTDPDMVDSGWDFTKKPEDDPNQSWYVEDDANEDDDWGDYDDYDDDDDDY